MSIAAIMPTIEISEPNTQKSPVQLSVPGEAVETVLGALQREKDDLVGSSFWTAAQRRKAQRQGPEHHQFTERLAQYEARIAHLDNLIAQLQHKDTRRYYISIVNNFEGELYIAGPYATVAERFAAIDEIAADLRKERSAENVCVFFSSLNSDGTMSRCWREDIGDENEYPHTREA